MHQNIAKKYLKWVGYGYHILSSVKVTVPEINPPSCIVHTNNLIQTPILRNRLFVNHTLGHFNSNQIQWNSALFTSFSSSKQESIKILLILCFVATLFFVSVSVQLQTCFQTLNDWTPSYEPVKNFQKYCVAFFYSNLNSNKIIKLKNENWMNNKNESIQKAKTNHQNKKSKLYLYHENSFISSFLNGSN